MPVLVTPDGRYHGHVVDKESALKLSAVKEGKEKGHRLLSDAEWNKITETPDQRATLCASSGEKIS